MDSVKKVKQSDSTETKDPNKDKMASTSLDDRQGEDGADMSVPPGIRLLFSNLSNDIQSSHDKPTSRSLKQRGNFRRVKNLVLLLLQLRHLNRSRV